MSMQLSLRTVTVLGCMALALAVGHARAEEVPMVTGELWVKSSEQVKKAYLVGIANVVLLEAAYAGANAPSDTQSTVPRFIKGLRGQTLDSVRQSLDAWYGAHPDRLQRPVIETIWFELVVPGLEKNR